MSLIRPEGNKKVRKKAQEGRRARVNDDIYDVEVLLNELMARPYDAVSKSFLQELIHLVLKKGTIGEYEEEDKVFIFEDQIVSMSPDLITFLD